MYSVNTRARTERTNREKKNEKRTPVPCIHLWRNRDPLLLFFGMCCDGSRRNNDEKIQHRMVRNKTSINLWTEKITCHSVAYCIVLYCTVFSCIVTASYYVHQLVRPPMLRHHVSWSVRDSHNLDPIRDNYFWFSMPIMMIHHRQDKCPKLYWQGQPFCFPLYPAIFPAAPSDTNYNADIVVLHRN